MTQRVAAARAGIGERTARKYEQATALPSQLKRPHDWKTRVDPFEQDWPWVVSQLERDPALHVTTPYSAVACVARTRSGGDVCDICTSQANGDNRILPTWRT
jgi:hypothetical protein